MTTFDEPRVWLDQFLLGEPQPLEHDYHGLRYPGEVIRADVWQAEWSQPLTEDTYCRIVLLVRRPEGLPPPVADRRIALCLPAGGVYQRRESLVSELATVRETQSLYLTHRDAETDLIRRSLQRRQNALEQDLMTQEVERYASGTVLVGPEQQELPNDQLAEADDAVSWLSQVADRLLAEAYPSLPIDADALPRPVTQQDPDRLFQAIFSAETSASATRRAGQPNHEPGDILSQLGPAPGLSSFDNPATFNPRDCPALELVRDRRPPTAEATSWADLVHYLGHQVGLTRPLATLYLLVFLHQERPELEVRLSADHQLRFGDGGPLTGTRLTSDLLRPLVWDDRLADWGDTIGPVTPPTWNDALHYLRPMASALEPVAEGHSFGAQEQQLLRESTALTGSLVRGQAFLSLLEERAGAALEPASNQRASFGRLGRISGDDFLSLYHSLRHVYTDYRLLEQDLNSLRRLAQLAEASDVIQQVWRYLDLAWVPPELSELSIEKQALDAAIAPASLLGGSRNWGALGQQVTDFKTRYGAAYRTHHQRLHQEVATHRRNLETASLKLRALELLNTIPELGPATGDGLVDRIAALDLPRTACPVPASELDLSEHPRCRSCQLRLEDSLRTTALNYLLRDIDAVLGDKHRQPSNLLVEKILHGQVDRQLEDFLKTVQASDLSALSNTINPELVTFIRRLLG